MVKEVGGAYNNSDAFKEIKADNMLILLLFPRYGSPYGAVQRETGATASLGPACTWLVVEYCSIWHS